MRNQLVGNIAIALLVVMLFSTPVNAGWRDIMKDVKDAVKDVKETGKEVGSVLNQDQAETEQQPEQEGKMTPEPPPPPVKAQDSELVRQIQQGLKELDYKPGTPDGYMGATTRSAILKFQKDNGLHADGKADNELLSSIENTLRQQDTIKDNTYAASTPPAENLSASKPSYKPGDDIVKLSEVEGITSAFIEYCTGIKIQAQDFSHSKCECILRNYSDIRRDQDKRELNLLEKDVYARRKTMLSYPGITTDKIDAVLRLFDSAREGKNEQKKELLNQAKKLAESYSLSPGILPVQLRPLANGKYSNKLHRLSQIRKDLAEDDGILYPSCKRELMKAKSYDGHPHPNPIYANMVRKGSIGCRGK
jgi:hypothetical protein